MSNETRIWSLFRFLMRLRYGTRGGLRPPLNRGGASSLLYRLRLWCWQIDSRLYRRTGLFKKWWRWMRGLAL